MGIDKMISDLTNTSVLLEWNILSQAYILSAAEIINGEMWHIPIYIKKDMLTDLRYLVVGCFSAIVNAKFNAIRKES